MGLTYFWLTAKISNFILLNWGLFEEISQHNIECSFVLEIYFFKSQPFTGKCFMNGKVEKFSANLS